MDVIDMPMWAPIFEKPATGTVTGVLKNGLFIYGIENGARQRLAYEVKKCLQGKVRWDKRFNPGSRNRDIELLSTGTNPGNAG